MKRCTKCQELKPPSQFYRNAGAPDGLDTRCGACKRAYQCEYNRRKSEPQRIAKQQRRLEIQTATRKACVTCNTEKPLEQFYKDGDSLDGRISECRECSRVRDREYRKRPHVAARKKARKRADTLRQRYGLTLDAWDDLRLQQGNRCALCRKSFESNKIHVDHDHVTGAVRGLLCPKCNVGLGLFNDDPEMLLCAAEYVRCGYAGMRNKTG